MSLTYKDIAEIIKLIDASSCDEFVVEVGDVKLAVRRRAAGAEQGALSAAMTRSAPSRSAAGAAPGRAARPSPPPEKGATVTADVAGHETAAREDGLIEVRSPMVGTFYRRPSPDAKPFVEVDNRVSHGDPLCLIDVMKLYTTIHAETSGRIAEIAAEDGQLVEYDQVLFLIEPA